MNRSTYRTFEHTFIKRLCNCRDRDTLTLFNNVFTLRMIFERDRVRERSLRKITRVCNISASCVAHRYIRRGGATHYRYNVAAVNNDSRVAAYRCNVSHSL